MKGFQSTVPLSPSMPAKKVIFASLLLLLPRPPATAADHHLAAHRVLSGSPRAHQHLHPGLPAPLASAAVWPSHGFLLPLTPFSHLSTNTILSKHKLDVSA